MELFKSRFAEYDSTETDTGLDVPDAGLDADNINISKMWLLPSKSSQANRKEKYETKAKGGNLQMI